MVYVDPLKLEAHQLSVMDVVRSVNESNLILPAGDVKIGPFDYSLYTNSQLNTVEEINQLPLKMIAGSPVLVGDIGHAEDGAQIQTSVVRVDGQRSVYLPVLKQGGDANTIAVVNGIKESIAHLVDVPKSLVAKVVFDQSVFVKTAIENIIHEGVIGMVLTGLMILIFLGNFRATAAVFLSIPLSVLATFIALSFGDSTINSMVLDGLALAFSRLIDNSVVVLENIFRHLELGESPVVAAEKGGKEMSLPVLAATLTTAVVFFPVTFLYGVSKFLFTALALSVVLSLFASYLVAMTVVPLFCAKFIKGHQSDPLEAKAGASQKEPEGWWRRFNSGFNRKFTSFLDSFDRVQLVALARPISTVIGILGMVLLSFALIPKLGFAYFPRTDPGQFAINLKTLTGTRIEITEQEVKKVENLIRRLVEPHDLRFIPIRASYEKNPARLDAVTSLSRVEAPTEVDHYQLQRVIDIYVAPTGEELGRVANAVNQIISQVAKPEGIRVFVRGSAAAMDSSLESFGFGLILALLLVYLILVAQFRSFIDPLIILLAVPPGISGVLLVLTLTGTTLNVMSLMGVVMMVGIVVSNSILIVEFTHRLFEDGVALREAVQQAVRVRLRPILMTSLATIFGLLPMALKLGTGTEAYAPLARAIIGGLLVSVTLTVFIVPSAVLIIYRRKQIRSHASADPAPV